MKRMHSAVAIILLVFLASCDHRPANSPVTTVNAPDCAELAKILIKSSSYKNFLGDKNTDLFVESVTDSLVTVHETQHNQDDRDVTVAWLQIDLKQAVIRNITVDPDSPDVYKIPDMKMFKELQEECNREGNW